MELSACSLTLLTVLAPHSTPTPFTTSITPSMTRTPRCGIQLLFSNSSDGYYVMASANLAEEL
eukprot:6243382-Amphidinium_carterae.1